MNDIKSPFFVTPNFLSPLMCDKILNNHEQVSDDDGLCILKPKVDLSAIIVEKVKNSLASIMMYYDTNLLNITTPVLYKSTKSTMSQPVCDSSKHLNGKWIQIHARDISGYIALSNYNDITPFDLGNEVYGGKLEFPQHQFGFNPQIGTLILYPSGPHFIHYHTPIEYGNLYYIQFFIKADTPYLYDPSLFPGDYTTWFKEI